MDVEHEAGRSAVGHRVEKLTGGGEALDSIALRLDQAMERPTD
jgi:hypothetical protein